MSISNRSIAEKLEQKNQVLLHSPPVDARDSNGADYRLSVGGNVSDSADIDCELCHGQSPSRREAPFDLKLRHAVGNFS